MTEKIHDKELDALKAEFARLREEIASLAAEVNKSTGNQAGQSRTETHREPPTTSEEGLGAWADLLRKLDLSRIQSEKIVKDLAAEVEHHPLISVVAAFSLGFILAKVLYKVNKK